MPKDVVIVVLMVSGMTVMNSWRAHPDPCSDYPTKSFRFVISYADYATEALKYQV